MAEISPEARRMIVHYAGLENIHYKDAMEHLIMEGFIALAERGHAIRRHVGKYVDNRMDKQGAKL